MGLSVLLALTVGLASTALAGTGVGARFDLGKVNVIDNATTTLRGSGPAGVLSSSLLEVKREGSTGIGAALRVDNTSTADAARGIDINVPTGEMPINVNSGAGKADLNVDRLDGKDSTDFATGTNGKASDADKLDGKDSSAFVSSTIGTAPNANLLDGQDSTRYFSGKTYIISNEIFGNGPNGLGEVSASCDPGDAVLSGGFTGISFHTTEKGFVTDIVTKSFPVDSRTWQVNFANRSNPNGSHSVYAICADFPPLR